MATMTDRSFKVRAGKVIKAVNALDAKDFTNVSAVESKVNSIVRKYFHGDYLFRFSKDIFFSEAVSRLVRETITKNFCHDVRNPVLGTISKETLDKPATKKPAAKKVAKKPAIKKPVVKKAAKKPVVAESTSTPPSTVLPPSSVVLNERVDIIFSFDDTGSISACRNVIRQLVDKISAEMLVAFGDKLNVGVIIHGDYCDPCEPIACLPMGKDWVKIKQFLDAPRRFMGGDAPECYELVLHKAQDFDWRAKSRKILVIIGDEVPHEPNYYLNKNKLNWRTETSRLKEMGVEIIGIQALDRRHADFFYETISDYHLRLTQFNQTADLLRAICYNGCGQLANYESNLRRTSTTVSPALMRNLDVLAGRATKVESVEGLSEFQMFEIKEDVGIREYVISMGMDFRKGCGYYEFMKPETVQDYKKVVVQDRNTEVFYPDAKGRELLRLPSSGSVRINPKHYDSKYRFFIQSTSVNRKLKANTTFLYDNRGTR